MRLTEQQASPVAFAAKLRATMAAIGCRGRKELCARFRAVNPATHCDLERLHKWFQGKALPRTNAIFVDLAAVLGSMRSGEWLATCSLADFIAEAGHATGRPAAELHVAASLPAEAASSRNPPPLVGGVRALAGTYACYSQSWSPHFRGKLVRSSMVCRSSGNDELRVEYAERIAGRSVTLVGELVARGRTVHVLLHEPEGQMPLFLCMHLPGPPVTALCGIIAGMAFISHEPLPSTSRFLALRVRYDLAGLRATDRYMDADAAVVADDLHAVGLTEAAAREIGPRVLDFIGVAPDQVTLESQRPFSDRLDRYFLD